MAAVVITDDAPDFSSVWPWVERQLKARLRRGGVPGSVIDDVVQETALVALAREVEFSTADELLAWTTTVARRLAVADHRRSVRLHVVDEVPERVQRPAEDDALLRVAVAETLRAIPLLSAADRDALAPTDRGLSRTEAVRMNVRRHRARNRLRALSSVAWAVGLVIAVRRHLSTVERITIVATMTTTAVALYALTIPFVGERSAGDSASAPPSAVVSSATAADARSTSMEGSTLDDRGLSDQISGGAGAPPPDATHGGHGDGVGEPVLPEASVAVPTPNGERAALDTDGGADTEVAICAAVLTDTETCAVQIPLPSTPLDDLSAGF